MSNFQFLESHWTDLAKLGDLSEKYVYSDPNTSIIKQGMLSEVMVKYESAENVISQIELMKKSILAKAFRGELGTNNPEEESSSELLKSIIEGEE